MSQSIDPNLLVPRTCTTRDERTGTRESRPLVDYRATPAYVLLGDPGAGKTKSFEHEAAATGGYYIPARDFAALDPSPQLSDRTLFIDGLDEMRAAGGDGRTPLYQVRRHLDRLGRPPFRISCREADWYGDSDSAALLEAAPNGEITVLHLDSLNDADITLLLEQKFGKPDPVEFVHQAKRHGLADLLRNPQTLDLLTRSVGKTWPNGRRNTYELACQQLLRETNPEHRAAKRTNTPTTETMLDAAGFLCAVHLLSGITGFALDDEAADNQHALWRELSTSRDMPLLDALSSGLFQCDEREQQRIPVHRSIAEFLGARYLTARIDKESLPLGRVVALMAGEDGGIVPDLRGLAAWLAVYCREARTELIGRDPLGVVLYGDVRDFQTDDKRRVLAALRGEAERYANFRFQDWAAAPFGTLATPDMVPVFLGMLASQSRLEVDIALLDCALDALRYGPPLAELVADSTQLENLLDAVARDAHYPTHIRLSAIKILLRDLPHNTTLLSALAQDAHAGTIKDEDDQLLGQLLTELYPEFIRPVEVFDFLHPARQKQLIGDYRMFWRHYLLEGTQAEMLPELLDQLSQRGPALRKALDHFEFEEMAGTLLVNALETHGDTIDDTCLYNWLGVGLGKFEYPRIDSKDHEHISSWLAARPARYKAILLDSAKHCAKKENLQSCLFQSTSRLYGAELPSDLVPWCLEQATRETHTEYKLHFFAVAARQLRRQEGQDWLTPDALDYLDPWITVHPEFEQYLEPFTSCDIEDWRRDDAARKRKWYEEHQRQKDSWRNHFHKHLEAMRAGSAHPHILYELAQVYLRRCIDIEGKTPHERLANFLSNDDELIEAAYAGFQRSLNRDDLPSVTEIINLETKGQMPFIREPCLAGMEELYGSNPEAALHLDDAVLLKLLAFRFTWVAENEADWFVALVKVRPDLVAEVLVAYALPLLHKGVEHPHGIWQLAYDDDFAVVARIALPDLLRDFPLRAKNKLLNDALYPLLKGALRHLDQPALTAIVSARLAQGSMSMAQRVYWLACGLMVAPREYEVPLAGQIGKSKAMATHLGSFLHDHERRYAVKADLPETTLALLIELLAPGAPPERPRGTHWVSPAMQTANEVRSFIDALGGNPSDDARQQLERLLALPKLAPWHNRLRHAAHAQRIARRKAGFRPLDAVAVCRTLANMQPANAADLTALADVHLRDLSRKIRDGSTNDYRQYWSLDESNTKLLRPKPENDCRDTLLSDLTERLSRLGVDAIKEGYYAEEKRADIRISFGGAQGFNVPIEIKKDSHADLWRAMREQLIERYARDPGADGFGIYLVFWFGGKNMPLPQERKKPCSATELEERLRLTLTADESRRIRVCVIDCALPK